MNATRSPGPRTHESAAALVTVLIVIVLVTSLLVGFLMRAGTERIAASHFHAAASANLLAGTVVNLVEFQINEATATGAVGTRTWASQPGAIRTYDSSGGLASIHRLFSAKTMTDADPGFTDDLPPADWSANAALWTDLNAPIPVADLTATLADGTTVPLGNNYPVYPILDPRDPAKAPGDLAAVVPIDGFAIDGANAVGASLARPVMPVRWLYVLQSGKIVAPNATGAGKVNVPGATAADPITGRISFWTDDETCKVNVNTAAGSAFNRPALGTASANPAFPAPWETPRFKSIDDLKLFSQNQPIKGEYSRYPGHPATTRLYEIFHGLGISLAADAADSAYGAYPYAPTNYAASAAATGTAGPLAGKPSALFRLLPRFNDDYGSRGGTVDTTLAIGSTVSAKPGFLSAGTGRLYASLGELLYDDQPLTGSPRAARNATGLTRQQLETGKFFLTTHSRAPEVNLFGAPRVSVWPVPYALSTNPATNQASGYDRLAAFCATTGNPAAGTPVLYHFLRRDSRSPTTDGTIGNNANLFAYLYALTSRGSVGGSAGENTPGYTGGTLAAKYQRGGAYPYAWHQILAEIIDYIRCTNVYDHSLGNEDVTKGTVIPRYTENYGTPGCGQVVPLKLAVPGTDAGNPVQVRGLGRIFTFSEAALIVICTANGDSPLTYQAPVTVTGYAYKVSPVVGSANDAYYVSNLPVTQYLRDTSGKIIDKTGGAIPAHASIPSPPDSTNPYKYLPFSSNKTLADAYSTADPGEGARLGAGTRRLQAMVVFEPNSPMQGYNELWPDYRFTVAGLSNVSIGGQTPFYTFTGAGGASPVMHGAWGRTNNTFPFGGLAGYRFFLADSGSAIASTRRTGWSQENQTAPANPYYLVSKPFTVPAASTLPLSRADGSVPITVTISVPAAAGSTTLNTVQTFKVVFPDLAGAGGLPMPDLLQTGLSYGYATATPPNPATPASDWWSFEGRLGWCGAYEADVWGSASVDAPNYGPGVVFRNDDPGQTVAGQRVVNWLASTRPLTLVPSYQRELQLAQGGVLLSSDVVRSLVPKDGDVRLIAARETVTANGNPDDPANNMQRVAGYDDPRIKLADMLMNSGASCDAGGCDLGGSLVAGLGPTLQYANSVRPKVPSTSTPLANWDWDNGLPTIRDGDYVNKPDEGNFQAANINQSPYYDALEHQAGTNEAVDASYFTANRIISSPVMFGSLPTGVADNTPWRTLLFRPMAGHDALGGPPDALVLDLFNMPVVEPYAISEPFSTAGKVNMNYQIQPFTYITRNTALRAVLGSELMARAPASAVSTYKGKPSGAPGTASSPVDRLPLNLDDTYGSLRQFKARFAGTAPYTAKDLFHSAADICSIYLVPQTTPDPAGSAYKWYDNAAADAAWYGDDFRLVGDNVRERPYSDVYPRLTTRSNTFTVHYRVQALKNPAATPDAWDEARGAVTGEYRGSTTIERYLDPNRSDIPDYTTGTLFDGTKKGLDAYYQWRVVEQRRFAP